MSRQGTRVTDTKKVSGELFSLTYGALVAQILKDYQNVEDVNKQLEKMGYNIGVRIVEDYLSRLFSYLLLVWVPIHAKMVKFGEKGRIVVTW